MTDVSLIDIALGGSSAYFIAIRGPVYGEKVFKWLQKNFKKWWRASKKRLKARLAERKARREKA